MCEPLISLVICTHNRANFLEDTLRTVETQTLNDDKYEVLIVDNNSSDSTPQVAKSYCDRHINASYYLEENIGLSHARNRGWMEAKGQYVGYTDDDVRLPPDWLALAADIIVNYDYEVFGGPDYPFYESPKPDWYKDEYGGSSWLPDYETILEKETLIGNNMFFSRELLKKSAGFPTEYGMQGGKIGYGEDTYFQIELRKHFPEIRIFYSPKLYLYHLVRENKMRVSWAFHRYFRQGVDSARFLVETTQDLNFPQKHEAFWNILTAYVKMIVKILFGLCFRNRKKYPKFYSLVYEVTRCYAHPIGFNDFFLHGQL